MLTRNCSPPQQCTDKLLKLFFKKLQMVNAFKHSTCMHGAGFTTFAKNKIRSLIKHDPFIVHNYAKITVILK